MKIELRLPTSDQYAYIGLELADNETLTDEMIQEASENYRRSIRQIRGNTGITTKDFNHALDEFLESGTLKNGVELYEKMDLGQQSVFQEIKKSLKRIEAKNNNV